VGHDNCFDVEVELGVGSGVKVGQSVGVGDGESCWFFLPLTSVVTVCFNCATVVATDETFASAALDVCDEVKLMTRMSKANKITRQPGTNQRESFVLLNINFLLAHVQRTFCAI
jgi:hypothetical protein